MPAFFILKENRRVKRMGPHKGEVGSRGQAQPPKGTRPRFPGTSEVEQFTVQWEELRHIWAGRYLRSHKDG